MGVVISKTREMSFEFLDAIHLSIYSSGISFFDISGGDAYLYFWQTQQNKLFSQPDKPKPFTFLA